VQVLALDFDGVISDSAPEAFVVALRTYVALRSESPLASDLAELDRAGSGLDRSLVTGSRLYADYIDFMPLGNRAEDFGVELAALEAGHSLRDQADYDAFKRKVEADDPGFQPAFHARFYLERAAFAETDGDCWRGLLGPYPEFLEILRRRAGDRVLAIATAKDLASVERLLIAYGIADLFGEHCVLDKETGSSKRAHLEELQRRTAVPFESIGFVDDKVNHLEDVASLGVRCALAAWGYNGPREHERARACGFDVCSLGDAEHVLFD
jgi:phosphoglycolate phosphatase-like HAD superfamily hydrolase